MSSLKECPVCHDPYDDDPNAFTDKSISRLPVQSAKCRHMMCCSCITDEINIRISEAKRVSKWLKCPVCRMNTCFDSGNPNISYAVCEARREVRLAAAAAAAAAAGGGGGAAATISASQPSHSQEESASISSEQNSRSQNEPGKIAYGAADNHDEDSGSVVASERAESNTLEAMKGATAKKGRPSLNPTANGERIYGDRFLIGRHNSQGIMKLGGSAQDTNPQPRENHPRLQSKLGDLPICCFSDIWQSYFAPQFAGQNGCVDWVPDSCRNGAEFALFMRRSLTKFGPEVKTQGPLLGWEYCGNYTVSPDSDKRKESALSFSYLSKRKIAKNNLKSAQSEVGYGCIILDRWRARLEEAIKRDKSSPPGPKWMLEKRRPTDEEKKLGQYPLAARARALGYKTGISDKTLSDIIVELDEFFTLVPITFNRYQEEVYEYIKSGKTNHNAKGKTIGKSESAARASDWYAFLDTLSF